MTSAYWPPAARAAGHLGGLGAHTPVYLGRPGPWLLSRRSSAGCRAVIEEGKLCLKYPTPANKRIARVSSAAYRMPAGCGHMHTMSIWWVPLPTFRVFPLFIKRGGVRVRACSATSPTA